MEIGLSEEKIAEMFNLTPKENCCNCIAIVLYSTGDINRLYDYLYSMKKSLDNVSNKLEDFIVRFYLDKSIFSVIYETYKQNEIYFRGNNLVILIPEDKRLLLIKLVKIFNMLKYIYNHPCAEIFLYFCKNIIDNNLLEKIRIFRFLPMIEDDVNIFVCREADGFVSYVDCHNIKLFSRNTENKIAMFYNLTTDFLYLRDKTELHYSEWLNIYEDIKTYYKLTHGDENIKKYIDTLSTQTIEEIMKYTSVRKNYEPIQLIDILAGSFCIKIKFNSAYLYETIKLLYSKLDCLADEFLKHKYSDKVDIVKIGFDEMLLEELFFPLISYNYNEHIDRYNAKKNLENLFELVVKNRKIDTTNVYDITKFTYEYRRYLTYTESVFRSLPKLLLKQEEYETYSKTLSGFNINDIILQPYLLDMLFKYKLKEEEKDKYYSYGIHLSNITFRESLEKDRLYSAIYPQHDYLYINYEKKYLKYKNKYLKLSNKYK